MRTGFISIKNVAIAIGIIAALITLTFTIRVIAGEWNGKIGDTKTITLDPSQCTGGGGGGAAGPCYKILTCAPASPKCVCDSEGDWH